MAWHWDISQNAILYVVYMATVSAPGLPSPWLELATTPLTYYDHAAEVPLLGQCLVYDVEARNSHDVESSR